MPPETWQVLSRELDLPGDRRHLASMTPPTRGKPRLQTLIIDCVGLASSKSHYGFPAAMAFARRLGPRQTYLTDLPHATSHECWEYACRKWSEGAVVDSPPSRRIGTGATHARFVRGSEAEPLQHHTYGHFDPHDEDYELFASNAISAAQQLEPGGDSGDRPWVRPLYDGQRLVRGSRVYMTVCHMLNGILMQTWQSPF